MQETPTDDQRRAEPTERAGTPADAAGTTRRRLLLAGASATTVLAAGCSDILSQSFEASAVTLPSESQETLQLGEAATQTQTLNQEGPGDAEVTITNQVTVYTRSEWTSDGSG